MSPTRVICRAKCWPRGAPPDTPLSAFMTRDPLSLDPSALGSDILHMMLEHRIGHVPITRGPKLVGMITQTDLTRFQAVSSAQLVRDAANATDYAGLADVTARIPQLLMQLVGAHNAHDVIHPPDYRHCRHRHAPPAAHGRG